MANWMDSLGGADGQHRAGLVSFLIILVSEIGDKTFFIAAILAMSHPRMLILSAALLALAVMTVLSAFLGHFSASIISKRVTQLLAAVLFLVFGIKMLFEAHGMTGDEASEEMESVSHELQDSEKTSEMDSTERGGRASPSNADKSSVMAGLHNLAHLLFSPIFMQTFVMTFLAEWGDRSQIATIALAGSEDFLYVTIGGLLGHAVCTSIAVIGGRMLASRISVKTGKFRYPVLLTPFARLPVQQLHFLAASLSTPVEAAVKP
ncbi:MAG: hypothetical protein SGCHY_004994 [Lobulomycetales sp.]